MKVFVVLIDASYNNYYIEKIFYTMDKVIKYLKEIKIDFTFEKNEIKIKFDEVKIEEWDIE